MFGVLHLDIYVDVEEVLLPVAHDQVQDVAPGLADDGGDLAQHARGVLDGGADAGGAYGAALGLGRPLQVLPDRIVISEVGQLLAVDGVDRQPGLWLQKITTQRPSRDQIEVAIASVKAALRK